MLTIPELTDMGDFCFWKRIRAADSTHLVLEFFYRCAIRGTVILLHPLELAWASLVAQRVMRLPTVWETWVRSLGQEDPRRRKWQPTLVLLPGKSHGLRSLVGRTGLPLFFLPTFKQPLFYIRSFLSNPLESNSFLLL